MHHIPFIAVSKRVTALPQCFTLHLYAVAMYLVAVNPTSTQEHHTTSMVTHTTAIYTALLLLQHPARSPRCTDIKPCHQTPSPVDRSFEEHDYHP